MEKQDWIKIARWMGYVYLPIALLVIFIFVLIQWNAHKIDSYQKTLGIGRVASSTAP